MAKQRRTRRPKVQSGPSGTQESAAGGEWPWGPTRSAAGVSFGSDVDVDRVPTPSRSIHRRRPPFSIDCTTMASTSSSSSSLSTGISDAPYPLTPLQLAQFHRDGFLLLPDFFDPAPLLQESQSIVQDFDVDTHPLTKFTTSEEGESKHIGDDFFLESGDKVRHFLEEEAVQDGKLVRPKERAVNKVGHALHLHTPLFHAFTFSPRLQSLAKSLSIHAEPLVLQSMIICKQPAIGGAVPHHNDSTFLYTDPPSAIGFWFALEDCTLSNGCLSFLEGSHRWPKGEAGQSEAPRPAEESSLTEEYGVPRGINKRFTRRGADGSQGTTFSTLASDEEAQWDEQGAKVVECKKGSLVLIHGSVLHQSKKNLSDKSRFIYTFHMIDGQANYDELNWLQPTTPEGRKEGFSRLFDPPRAPQVAA